MSNRYYLALGPEDDVQELTAESRDFEPQYEEDLRLTRRAASGKLRAQWRAIKQAWKIVYEAVPTATITRLETLYELKSELTLQYYDDIGSIYVLQTKTVLMEPFGATRVLSAHGGLWAVTIILREV